jgi:hypothetical protein
MMQNCRDLKQRESWGKAPFSYGATDVSGWKAEQHVCSVQDYRATILHMLGLDHEGLSYYNNGIERLHKT